MKTKTPVAERGQLSKHVKFTVETIHRGRLVNAVYNPRLLTEKAKQKLKRSLSRFGLVEPPIWNKRSGNIVGGHQRMGILDAFEGTPDYMLPVAVVDLDDASEKALNVMLNNTTAMGDYDLGKLEAILKDANPEDAGFDSADIFQLFGDGFLKQDAAAIAELSEQVRAARERYAKVKDSVGTLRDDPNFYNVLVFKNREERAAFAAKVGLDDNKWLDGSFVAGKIPDSQTPDE